MTPPKRGARTWRRALFLALLLPAVGLAPELSGRLALLEPAVPSLLFMLALLLALAHRMARGRRARLLRRMELRVVRVLTVAGPALAVTAFLLPLWSHWNLEPTSRVSAIASLFGEIPWMDAHGHYEGATRLLAEGRLNAFTERRPLNTPWLAARLALTGFRGALVLQAALLGLAAWVLARTLGARAGLAAGVACFALVYGFERDYLALVVAEPLGVTLACLGTAALFVFSRSGRLRDLGAGLLLLELALRTRPGAQLLLPCVALWALWRMRGRRLAALGLTAAVLLTGEMTTRGLLALYGSGNASFSTYPAYTLYGLATGANYVKAKEDFATELAQRPETEVAPLMYAAALRRIRETPQHLVAALAANLFRFFEKLPANAARVLSPRSWFARGPDWVRPEPEQSRLDLLLSLAILLVTVALFASGRRVAAPEHGLLMALLAGVVASAPFVFGDAGYRGLAVGHPIVAAVLALGLRAGPRAFGARAEARLAPATAAFAVTLVAMAFLAPPLLRVPPPRTPMPSADALLDLRLASAVRVTPVPSDRRTLELSLAEYRRLIGYARLPDGAEVWRRQRAPFAVISAFDHATRRQRLLIAPTDLLDGRSPFRLARLRPLAASADGEEPGELFAVDSWQEPASHP